MELWREKIQSLEHKDLIQNISGADKINETCDYLFYTNFSEIEAESFFGIFQAFNKYYTTQSIDKDLRQLSSNLQKQISVTSVPPLELILYTSRVINKYIENNERIFNSLTSILQAYIKDNYESVSCMANTWEWKNQLLMLAEACGRANDDKAIEIMMNNYYRICNLFGQSDKVQKAFIRMLIHTQNEKNIKYMADIVASPQFYNNPECHKLLKRPIMTSESFVSQFEEDFLDELFVRKIPNNFRIKVKKVFGRTQEVSTGSFIWEWGSKSTASVFKFSMVNNKDELPRIIDMVIDNYPKITGDLNRQKVLFTIGTKVALCGDYQIAEKAQDFLSNILKENSILNVGAYLGLSELKMADITQAFEAAFEMDDYYSVGATTLGYYFRYRKNFVNEEFITFIEEKFKMSNWNSTLIRKYIERIKCVIDIIDGKGEAELNKLKAFNSRIMDLFDMAVEKQLYDTSTYNNMLDILLLIAEESVQHKGGVIRLLEKTKNISGVPNYIVKRIEGLIKKLQPPALPM